MCRSFKAGCKTLESISCSRNERIDHVAVVLHDAHEAAPAESAEEINRCIFRCEEVDLLAGLEVSNCVNVCVLTGTCNAGEGLCVEAYVKTMESEDLLDEDSCDKLIVSALECI